MHPIRVEYQVELANILKPLVQCLHKYLDQIQYTQVGLLRVHGKNKVERGVVSVNELDVLAPLGHGWIESDTA